MKPLVMAVFYLKINSQITEMKKQTHLFFFQNFKGKIYQKTGK